MTEELKLQRSPITAPRFPHVFSPVCGCPQAVARLTLRLRKRDRVDAVVVDRQGKTVRALATDEPHRKGNVTFRWDGRDKAGGIVPDGRYRLRIHLDRQRRTILLPNTVLVDTKPPKAKLLRVSRRTFSPDGNAVNDRIKIVYRANEKASAILLVDGRPVVVGKARPPGRSSLQWSGKIGGQAAEAGVYAISLQVRDRAGNLSEPAAPVSVSIAFIHLTKAAYTVARGGLLRFRVATDALPYSWSFAYMTRHGSVLATRAEESRNALAYRIAKDARPGRYELEVKQGDRTVSAAVIVTRERR